MANHSTTKLAAFAATAHCAPNGTSAVASSGPITRPEFQLVMPEGDGGGELLARHEVGEDRLQRRRAERAGAALEQHEQAEHRRVAQPGADDHGDDRRHDACAPSVARNTRRRSKRSASRPPIGEHRPCGANVAAAISAGRERAAAGGGDERADRRELHPRADVGRRAGTPEQPEGAMTQRSHPVGQHVRAR